MDYGMVILRAYAVHGRDDTSWAVWKAYARLFLWTSESFDTIDARVALTRAWRKRR